MNDPLAIFAQVDLLTAFVWVIKVAAGVGGAIVGWFATGPVVRLLYRVAFHRPVPSWLLPWTKAGGAVLLGFLFYLIVSLGGGLGLGWGAGDGGGDKQKVTRTRLTIELIGLPDPRFKGEERYYLLNDKTPAMNRNEVEAHFKKSPDPLEVFIKLTDTSPGLGLGVLDRLHELMTTHEIPNVTPREKEPKDR